MAGLNRAINAGPTFCGAQAATFLPSGSRMSILTSRRSLSDFAKLVERLEAAGAVFVSVTQSCAKTRTF